MDELLTKDELIRGIRKRTKYENKAKGGAIASAMLATGAAIAAKSHKPLLATTATIATVPALAYTLNKARTSSKYKKLIKNNRDIYRLDQLEYGQLNNR